MAAVQAAIPVARLSETEGSSNAVGCLEISGTHRHIPHRRRLGRQLQFARRRHTEAGGSRQAEWAWWYVIRCQNPSVRVHALYPQDRAAFPINSWRPPWLTAITLC